jgi:autotransporter-associated beta strand protein
VLSDASVTKIGTGTLKFAGANTYAGLTTVNGGTLELGNAAARTNVLANPQGIDIQAGQVVFDYAGAGDDPKVTVLANLKASYLAGTGPWTSGPMFSTTAAGSINDLVGLGWVDDGVGTITVKPAVYGDADMNGAVGTSDLSLVLTNFGKPGVWSTGDFDYNDTVGTSDLSIVLTNFGQTLPSTFNVSSYSDLSAEAIGMMNAAGIKTVPEPGTIALLAAGLLGLLAYAWRKRK